jgi:hypothetical protein
VAPYFLISVAPGIVVALVSFFLQGRFREPPPIFTRRSEWQISRAVFQDGQPILEEHEIRIEESTIQAPEPSKALTHPIIPVLAGLVIFSAVLAILLLV